MPSSEEYRQRAKEARKQANECRNEWERQGLLTIAQQCERLAAYKDLTARRSVPSAPAAQDSHHGLQYPARAVDSAYERQLLVSPTPAGSPTVLAPIPIAVGSRKKETDFISDPGHSLMATLTAPQEYSSPDPASTRANRDACPSASSFIIMSITLCAIL